MFSAIIYVYAHLHLNPNFHVVLSVEQYVTRHLACNFEAKHVMSSAAQRIEMMGA